MQAGLAPAGMADSPSYLLILVVRVFYSALQRYQQRSACTSRAYLTWSGSDAATIGHTVSPQGRREQQPQLELRGGGGDHRSLSDTPAGEADAQPGSCPPAGSRSAHDSDGGRVRAQQGGQAQLRGKQTRCATWQLPSCWLTECPWFRWGTSTGTARWAGTAAW